MSALKWTRPGEAGHRTEVGSLVRWRDVPRGPWRYAYWRGQNDHRALIFSMTPRGPITIWKTGLGNDWQAAQAVPLSGVVAKEGQEHADAV